MESEDNETVVEFPEQSEPELQIVYVLTNPCMPGLIKIGRTTNLEARVASLSSSTSVPQAFEVAYAAYVEDSAFVERALHAAFSMHRLPGREFFRMPATNAIAAISLAEIEQVSLAAEEERAEQIVSEIRERGKRGRKGDARILNFVANFQADNGRTPSGAEIRNVFPELPVSTAYDYSNRARITG